MIYSRLQEALEKERAAREETAAKLRAAEQACWDANETIRVQGEELRHLREKQALAEELRKLQGAEEATGEQHLKVPEFEQCIFEMVMF